MLRKYCSLTERILDARYIINDTDLYKMYLNELIEHAESMTKRYADIETLISGKTG